MGEAKRRAANGAGGEGPAGAEATTTLDEMIKQAKPPKAMPICPLPLMNFRPSMVTSITGQESAVPALPCLGGQCILYSEGIIQTGEGLQRRPICGLGGASFALSQNIAPILASLGETLATALEKREERMVEHMARAFADALDAVFPEDPEEEPENEPGVKPPAVTSLAALVPAKD